MPQSKHQRSTFQFRERELLTLLNDSAAGIAISGDSGAGKSNTLLLIAQTLLNSGVGLTVIDPHGDLAQDIEHHCAALSPRFRARVQIIRPSDLAQLVAINPLYVPNRDQHWLRWRARIAAKVSQVARILLYAWGERDFNSKPVLFKWLTRVLTTLATTGLTIPDARHFFQVEGEIYTALARATPDALARMEMRELIDMKPREREDLVASTKNRLLGFLSNPLIELILGRPQGWLDVGTLVRHDGITIISLERAGVLREEDQEILANLWLCELLDAVYNVPRHERRTHVVMVDELPVFSSSFDVLTRAAAQVRKYLTRFVFAWQGTSLFPERTDDRLLHALISQCRTTVVFRHKNPVDAKFYSELLTLPVLDPRAEKHRLTQSQQYQAGHDVVYLTDESESWSDAVQAGGSQSDGHSGSTSDTESANRSTTRGETLSRDERVLWDVVQRSRSEQASTANSRATTQGTTATTGSNWSHAHTHGGSRTRKMTLVPRLAWREIVTSIQFLSLEEQIALGARDITQLAIGEAFLYLAGHRPLRVRFPLAQRPFERTPKFATKQLLALRGEIHARPMFAAPERIIAERQEFERCLVEHLHRLARDLLPVEPSPRSIPRLPIPY